MCAVRNLHFSQGPTYTMGTLYAPVAAQWVICLLKQTVKFPGGKEGRAVWAFLAMDRAQSKFCILGPTLDFKAYTTWIMFGDTSMTRTKKGCFVLNGTCQHCVAKMWHTSPRTNIQILLNDSVTILNSVLWTDLLYPFQNVFHSLASWLAQKVIAAH